MLITPVDQLRAHEFTECDTTAGSTHFLWLVPIHRVEAKFVRRFGWQQFEDLLEKQDPDLLDLHRQQIQLPAVQEMA